MSSYHGWTHRPKAQGGTDPIPTATVTAAFMWAIPTGTQQIETAGDWTPVAIDPAQEAYNYDLTFGGPAIAIVEDTSGDVLAPGCGIVFLNADTALTRHYWVVGATVDIGSFLNDGNFDLPAIDLDLESLEPIAGAVAVRPFLVGLCIADRGSTTGGRPMLTQQIIPSYADDGADHIAYFFRDSDFGGEIASLTVAAAIEFSRLNHDPADADVGGLDLRDGLQVQVIQTIPVTPSQVYEPNVDWPAIRGGYVWGYRYAIGDGVTH